MNKSIFAIILLLFVLLFAFPVKVPCGAPSVACAIPPKTNESQPSILIVVEPLGVKLLEILTHSDIQIQYSSSFGNAGLEG